MEIEKEKVQLNKEKSKYLDLIKAFRQQKDAWLEKFQKKSEKRIDGLLEEARLAPQKNKTLHDIKSDLPQLIKATSKVLRPTTIEEFNRFFTPGSQVHCSRLNRSVILQSHPDPKGQVYVLADSMRVLVPWHTISDLADQGRPAVVPQRGSGASKAANDDSLESFVADLRGLTSDEAISKLDSWLDECIRASADRVKVIHGFGTEQLKKSVRQYLSKSPYIASWTPGDSTTGGDGVTWAILRD
jgi:DNA mismatch repair protein MutS2